VIVYSRDAEQDVERLHDWLVEFGARSAEVFMVRLAIAERRMEDNPLRYRRLRDGGTRRYSFRLNRTTYLMDYRVDAGAVVVLRVWHGRQDRPE
jgi:plasmid stabilization system protein ParE